MIKLRLQTQDNEMALFLSANFTVKPYLTGCKINFDNTEIITSVSYSEVIQEIDKQLTKNKKILLS